MPTLSVLYVSRQEKCYHVHRLRRRIRLAIIYSSLFAALVACATYVHSQRPTLMVNSSVPSYDGSRLNDRRALELHKDYDSNMRLLRAAGGLDLRRVPSLGGHSQMLGGWASEEKVLDILQKKAEARLAKDPKASESNFGDSYGDQDDSMVVDDSGEKVPEATLRAEAAALGYTDVRAWKHDHFSSSLKGAHAAPAPSAARASDPRLERRSIVTDVVAGLGRLFGRFFRDDSGRVQQLAAAPPAQAVASSRAGWPSRGAAGRGWLSEPASVSVGRALVRDLFSPGPSRGALHRAA